MSMTIIYCGDLWPGSTSGMRAEALRRIGHQVLEVDTTYVPKGLSGLAIRAFNKIGYVMDPVAVNVKLLDAMAGAKQPRVVWVDKGLCVGPGTLKSIRQRFPNVALVHYSADDMGGRHNQSPQYLAGIPLYDLHVTTKSFNSSELQTLGARAVLFVNNAYCPMTHRPILTSSAEKCLLGGPVGFIGAFENDRAEKLLFLARNGVPVRIWGSGWGRWARKNAHPGMLVEGRCLWGEDYVKALCSFEINLGFLRKLNRDLQTTRSMEIPACGGFMLAERSSEHLALFTEHSEAEFFEDEVELLEKCQHYLARADERAEIARGGRARCLQSDYSYTRHVDGVLERLEELRPHYASLARR